MRKITYVALLGMLAFSFIGFFMPASAATPPLLWNMGSAVGYTNSLIITSVPVNAGYGIIVEEWIGGQIGNSTTACSYLTTPTDSLANSFTAIGSCLPDQSGGAMEAYKATNGASTTTDLVNCKYHSPNSQIESCYAFNISNPGTITELASGTGISNRQNTTTQTASGGALLLITASLQFYCTNVVGGDFGFQQYRPSSACGNGGQIYFQSGMAGGLENIGSTGFTSNFPLIAGSQSVVWAEEVIQVAEQASTSTTTGTITSYTLNVTGWLTPDSTHFSNSLILIIFPLCGMVVCLVPFMMFQKNHEIGDKAIYPALFGLMVGSAAADLGSNPATPLAIPFADTLVAAFLLFMWWWNS